MKLNFYLVGKFESSLAASMQEYIADGLWEYSKVESLNSCSGQKAMFLTICSHRFRIFTVILYSSEECKEFILSGLSTNKENVDDNALDDYMMEVSNSVSGTFKRDVGSVIPALGMSTPHILDKDSVIEIEKYSNIEGHFRQVKLNQQHLFYIGYFYSPNTDEDIEVEEPMIESDVDSGELELF
ncbi:MAG: hypothetical protein OQK51_21665 [Kangiellaceae bacterium]|nr:hypothetical protein [Kangiellaceae bacterium]